MAIVNLKTGKQFSGPSAQSQMTRREFGRGLAAIIGAGVAPSIALGTLALSGSANATVGRGMMRNVGARQAAMFGGGWTPETNSYIEIPQNALVKIGQYTLGGNARFSLDFKDMRSDPYPWYYAAYNTGARNVMYGAEKKYSYLYVAYYGSYPTASQIVSVNNRNVISNAGKNYYQNGVLISSYGTESSLEYSADLYIGRYAASTTNPNIRVWNFSAEYGQISINFYPYLDDEGNAWFRDLKTGMKVGSYTSTNLIYGISAT